MSQAPLWVLVALFGILVAVSIPVLLQLRKTLTTADSTLEIAERRLGVALKELTETLTHVTRASQEAHWATESRKASPNTTSSVI